MYAIRSYYERAQLAAADLSLAFDGRGLGRFDDLQNLTIFADNLVPHVLRVDNILIYPEARITSYNVCYTKLLRC